MLVFRDGSRGSGKAMVPLDYLLVPVNQISTQGYE